MTHTAPTPTGFAHHVSMRDSDVPWKGSISTYSGEGKLPWKKSVATWRTSCRAVPHCATQEGKRVAGELDACGRAQGRYLELRPTDRCGAVRRKQRMTRCFHLKRQGKWELQ